MNSNILSISSVLAAAAIVPVSAASAAIAFTLIGILAVFVADYGRTFEMHRLPGDPS